MQNSDPCELAKFSKLATSWWDHQGPSKALHDINPLRLAFIKAHATLQGQRVLDVGCGGGILSEALAKEGAVVTGIDLSAQGIEVAQLHAQQQKLNIHYLCQSIEALRDSKPEKFDLVCCMELLEHVPHPDQLIRDCIHSLKPGGKLIVSTLNRNPKSFFQAIIGAEYILGLLPKGTHDYGKFIRPSELASWCRNAGASIKRMRGMGYRPISKKYYLSDNIQVNYLVYAEKNHD